MLVVDVSPGRTTVTPAFVEDLRGLVDEHKMDPDKSPVLDIGNPKHKLSEAGMKSCLRTDLQLVIK